MWFFGQMVRFAAAVVVGAFLLTGIGVSAANAQSQALTVKAFLAQPTQLLQHYPDGGQQLTDAVKQLALEEPATFTALLALVPHANDLQKSAIGTGLAQAAKIEVLTNQTLAADWQQQLATIDDPVFATAVIDALGEVELGAVGGGPLGGPLGGPNLGPTRSNPAQEIRPTSVPTSTFTFNSSTTAATSPWASQPDPAKSVSP